MPREIKFRAWDTQNGSMFVPTTYSVKGYCELMQYTGLKDKNGKEIYEGDILNVRGRSKIISVGAGAKQLSKDESWTDWHEYTIEVYTEPAMWLARHTNTGTYNGHLITVQAHALDSGGSLEVIGNKYENPELL